MAQKNIKIMTQKELDAVVSRIPDDRRALAKDIAAHMWFLSRQMAKCMAIVRREGPITKFEQGKQQLDRENPALKSYRAMAKDYRSFDAQLAALLPRAVPCADQTQEDNDFDDFVSGRDED